MNFTGQRVTRSNHWQFAKNDAVRHLRQYFPVDDDWYDFIEQHRVIACGKRKTTYQVEVRDTDGCIKSFGVQPAWGVLCPQLAPAKIRFEQATSADGVKASTLHAEFWAYDQKDFCLLQAQWPMDPSRDRLRGFDLPPQLIYRPWWDKPSPTTNPWV